MDNANIGTLEAKIEELSKQLNALEKKIETGIPTNKLVILLISGDMDRALAALSVSLASLAMGYEVVIYCTFWGLNLLRKKTVYAGTPLLKKAAKWMMPRGPENASLSKMHMAGVGTYFMKNLIKSNKTKSLPEMLELAKGMGLKIYACEMMMDVTGITREEIGDDVTYGGASCYVGEMSSASANLVI